MVYDAITRIGYRISPVLKDLPLKEEETITALATHENNIYVGTSLGNLLHFHRFEDTTEYISITSLEVNSHPVTKLLCVPQIQRLLVISNRTTFAFALPELSPCHMKKMKDVSDLQLLDNSILVLSPSKIRIIRIQDDKIMVVREINYSGAVTGNYCRDSHFIIVANHENYDIIDLDNNRKVPLFGYKTDADVRPIIVSFDKEYLLTILSDAKTSMAMFINSSGDVTRGTLTWVDQGYPSKGIVIESNYVFAAFEEKLVVSSLESLEAVAETNNELFTISRVSLMIVEDEEVKKLIDTSIQPAASQVSLCNGKEVYGVYPEHKLLQLQKKFLNHEELQVDRDDFTGEAQDYVTHMLLLSAIDSKKDDVVLELLNSERDGRLVVSPQFALYLFGQDHEKCSIYTGLTSFLESWEFPENHELFKKYILNLKPEFLTYELRLYYYGVASEDECLDFIPKDSFAEYDLETKSIIELLTEKQKFKSASQIFKLLQKSDAKDVTHDYSLFINDHLPNDLLEDAAQLVVTGSLEDADYAKTLIGVIKFDKDKGFAVLKKAPKKYQSINATILKDLSGDANNDKGFATLQIEVLEKAFKENPDLKGEVLDLLVHTLEVFYQDIKEDYDLLYEEFNEMNSLEKDKWPKIAWLDFLNICGKSKDLLVFVEVYLKSFELSLGSDRILEGEIFKYHRLFKGHDIPGLLDFGDYTTAEKLAGGEDPLPRKIYYNQPQIELPQCNQESLLQIFEFYLQEYTSGKAVEPAIKHFSEQYFKYIPVLDFLNLIPESFPLAYLVEYFNATIIDLNEHYRDALIRKAVSKAEAVRTTKLCKDFSK
ncbi:Vacuolar protein sorting-associated protein 3 [Candida viswanathii]|uniref:Vacuolar protein sorting-associated protein 3 n=1 Tax=Candida viswanathii TaxID=5486 RepID=A0A367YJL6_9ASCO|nr:Vacuolar protein sorting-associated protein 3 [Candida viswanathii]